MKVHLMIGRDDAQTGSPLRMAFGQIVQIAGGEVTEDVETADIIVVDSNREALRLLKETEDIPLVVCPGWWTDHRSELLAAESLAQAYPARVIVRHIMAQRQEDDHNPQLGIVPYLMATVGKEKTA